MLEKKLKVLIADDEKIARESMRDYLPWDDMGMEQPVCVENGALAWDYLCSHPVDLFIMDIRMPVMDGISVLQEIRKRGNLIPVLLLTAKSEIDDKVLGLDSGANDYLTKPFNSRELLARIRAITRVQTAQSSSQLHMGNVTLNRATFELSTPSGSFRLANKEFQMIELLMSNPRVLISSERFMEKIWGFDSEAEINVVWVYISYLRKKLTALNANIQIKATRNAGYSLEDIK